MRIKEDSIVILGGSFNPPTLAHKIILEHALNQTHAGEGIFVPSSGAYVSRKAKKQKSPLLFTEQQRLDMLNIMIKNDTRLKVSTCEYGDDGRGHTYQTMRRIQKENPGKTCCFLTGADKLRIIPRWHSAERFLTDFPFIIMSREEDNAHMMIERDPVLRRHRNTLIIISDIPEIDKISSSRFQKLYNEKDKLAEDLVDEKVYEYIKSIGEIKVCMTYGIHGMDAQE